LAADAHFVSACHVAFDPAFDGEPAMERVFELLVGRGPARQPAGQRQSALRRRHHCLDTVADGDLERALLVLQLGNFDQGLALPADIDERNLRADRDDGALDGLAFPDMFRLKRRLEHRGEVFIGFAHGALLVGR
jgi:hypothetical protein